MFIISQTVYFRPSNPGDPIKQVLTEDLSKNDLDHFKPTNHSKVSLHNISVEHEYVNVVFRELENIPTVLKISCSLQGDLIFFCQ